MQNPLKYLRNVSTRNCFLLVLVPMFLLALILRIVFAFVPPPRPDILFEVDGLFESSMVSDAQPHTSMPIVLPDDLLGSTVYTIGVYTKGTGTLPTGSTTIVLIKNNHRFVELVERPGIDLKRLLLDYQEYSSTDIVLETTTGKFIDIPSNHLPCVDANEKWELPGFCELTRMLVFEKDGVVYAISSDSSRATDGELITLAKDILF